MASWRRSEASVKSYMRGLQEYQWKLFIAAAKGRIAEHVRANGG
jgi:hypothetical protein